MDETNNDLYPVQLKDPEVPIQEDCTSRKYWSRS